METEWASDSTHYFANYSTFRNFISRQIIISAFYTIFSLYLPTFFTVQPVLFFSNYRAEEAKVSQLRAELANAQLSALKMQLQPYFLFNSLHSISSLTLLGPNRANKMVALLGDFLRKTLEYSGDQIVTLSEELEFLNCYLETEKTRFEDRPSVDFHLEPGTLNAEVPHLIMQPLVENAVKHGISPYSGSGHIEISARKIGRSLLLSVKNTGPDRSESVNRVESSESGFGLASVEARLESVYGLDAGLEIYNLAEEGFRAEITMPLSMNNLKVDLGEKIGE